MITFLIRGCLQSSKPIAHVHLLMYLTNPLPVFKLPYLTGGDASSHAEEIAFLFHIRGVNGSGMVNRWRKTPSSALGEKVNCWHIATPPSYWRPHRSWKENELRDERLGPVLAPPLGDLGQVIESL